MNGHKIPFCSFDQVMKNQMVSVFFPFFPSVHHSFTGGLNKTSGGGESSASLCLIGERARQSPHPRSHGPVLLHETFYVVCRSVISLLAVYHLSICLSFYLPTSLSSTYPPPWVLFSQRALTGSD